MPRARQRFSVNELLLAAGVFAVCFSAVWVSFEIRKPPTPPRFPMDMGTEATVLPEPLGVPAFALTDDQGRPFTQTSLQGQWSFLFFGYTYCPDVCPTTLAVLAAADKLLRDEPADVHPQTVFISVDPERDTSERIGEYVRYFDPSFIGATGPHEQLQALTRPLGILYRRAAGEEASDGSYLIDHSATVLMVDPKGRVRALTTPPHNAEAIAGDYRKILATFGKA